jgi:site-specific recombinase XerD
VIERVIGGEILAYEKKSLPYESLKAFQDLLSLRHQRPRTLEEYGARVRLIGEHYSADPAALSEKQVRDYLVFLIRDKGLRPASIRQARAALRLFFEKVAKVENWTVFDEVRTKDSRPLPKVLSRADVAAVLGALTTQRFRVVLHLIYACGLRLGEAVALEVRDIQSAEGRLHIRDGKGGKQRYVPLPAEILPMLRAYWKTHRHPRFIFPATGRDWRVNHRATKEGQAAALAAAQARATTPMSESSVQLAFKLALADSGVAKPASPHTLRHSYATHLLEEGVNIRVVSAYLGHASIEQTVVYLHLTEASEARAHEALARMLGHLPPS